MIKMRKSEKRNIIEVILLFIFTLIPMIFLSMPLMGIPPLGNLFFPGNGVWLIPGEPEEAERLNVPGLRGEVKVIRDEWGVPHIFAEYENDLFFAQGYCHAQDRLFQMDLIRRQVKGQLSEILGESYLPSDKFMLAIGMKDWAEKSDEVAREMQANGTIDFFPSLERYVDGINYYINTHKNSKPLEYYLLDFELTEWSTVDTFCLVQEMARQLSWNYNDFYRYLNLIAFNFTWYNELFGLENLEQYQIPIVPDFGKYPEISMKSIVDLQNSAKVTDGISNFLENVKTLESEKAIIENQELVGSNNWVVNGSKTNTGYPILCNDMHLGWILPGVWYEQHLKAEDTGLHVYGYAIPGMPLCAVGHNERIGWGFTNTGYDVIDWYYFNVEDENHYIYNGTITNFDIKKYKINVKYNEPINFEVKHTVQGPVLNDLTNLDLSDSLGDVVISPKWITNGIFYNLLAGNGFCRANNRAEFDEASRYWTILAQNIVYADIDGNIAIRPTGKVPIRDDSRIPKWHLGNGTIPYNGSNGEGEWIGFVPFDDLPSSFNPDQEYLVSANQLVAGPDYTKYFLQNEYANGYRARRINELLEKAPDGTISIETMKSIQNDVNSTAARAFIPELIDVIEYEYGINPPGKITNVYENLKDWDFVMEKENSAPTIYRKWRDYFYDYTFNDEIIKYGAVIGPQLVMLEYLMKENKTSHWFDNVSTPLIIESRNYTMLLALNATIDWLEAYYDSNDPSTWRWGDLHQLYFSHLTQLEPFNRGPYEADGEGYTINPSGVNIDSGTGYARGGPSERLIIDFSNLNNSLTVIPSGQRGNPASKHYSDQLVKLFLKGKYHYQYFSNSYLNFPTSSIESQIYFFPGGD